MARKTFEISFNIAGQLAGTFRSSFSSASAQMDKLKDSSKNLKSSLRSIEEAYKQGAISAAQYQAAQGKVAQSLERVQKAQERLNSVMRKQMELRMNAHDIQMQMSDTTAMGRPLVSAAKSAMDFETAMLGVAKQVEGARDDSGKLTATYYQMQKQIQLLGRELPIPTNEIAKMVESGARMNVPKQHLISFTKEVAKMSTAFEMPADEIADKMGKIANVMQIPVHKIGNLADTINYLDDSSVAKGQDIIEVLNRVGGTAKQVNMTEHQAAALGSTFLSLGKSAEVAGTASTALIRELALAKEQPKRFQQALSKLGMTSDQLNKSMVKDAQGTILSVLKKINALDKKDQTAVTVGLFGKEYGDDVAALAGAIKEYERQLGLLDDAKRKGSMNREFDARMGTSQAKLDLLKNSATETAVAVGDVLLPGLNDLFQTLAKVSQKLAEIAKEYPNVTKALVIGSTALIGARLGWLGVRFGINSAKMAMTGVQAVMVRGGANAAARAANKTANSAKSTAAGAAPKPGAPGSSGTPKPGSPKPGAGAPGTSAQATSKAAGKLATAGKVLGKAALPLTVASEAYNIAKSDDKTKATVQAAGGLAGGWAGAKAGAAIGTAIAPGIGTAIGGFLGGIGGYIAGKFMAGKATDAARSAQAQAASQPKPPPTTSQPGQTPGAPNTTAVQQQMTALAASVQSTTTTINTFNAWVGSTSGKLNAVFTPLMTTVQATNQSFSTLNTSVTQASSWVASINGIQNGATAVKMALSNLAQRISSVQVQGVSAAAAGGGKGSVAIKKYARGGIINRPHIGMVGEAGPETIIPHNNSPRSYSLWAQTGKKLGFAERANSITSSTSPIQLTYAPVIHGVDQQAIEPVLQKESANLVEKLQAISHQKARVSFG